jgi:hypothetical protein
MFDKIGKLAALAARNGAVAPQARQKILDLVRQPMEEEIGQQREPLGEFRHAPGLAAVVESQLAPSRFVVVGGIPLLSPGTESPGEVVDWQFSGGLIVAWRGGAYRVQAAAPPIPALLVLDAGTQAQCGVQCSFNGGEPIITNGDAEDWAWYFDLFGSLATWSPILRRVTNGDRLNLKFSNRGPATGASIQPSLTFAFLADKDIAGAF